jgi:hypothetical protein
MTILRLAMAVAVAGLLCCKPAVAEQPTGADGYLGERQVAHEFDSYYAQDPATSDAAPSSPSDVAPAPVVDEAAPISSGCCKPKCRSCCKAAGLGDPVRLFDGPLLDRLGVRIGGWMAQSYTWNPYRPRDRFNGPVTWTDRSNEYQMNELYTYMARDTNTDGSGWDIGGPTSCTARATAGTLRPVWKANGTATSSTAWPCRKRTVSLPTTT